MEPNRFTNHEVMVILMPLLDDIMGSLFPGFFQLLSLLLDPLLILFSFRMEILLLLTKVVPSAASHTCGPKKIQECIG